MSQSSELEEGEHPKSEEPSPVVKPPPTATDHEKSADENNHNHKLYTRGVGSLLGGILDSEPDEKEHEPNTPDVKNMDAIKLPESSPNEVKRPAKLEIEASTDHTPRVISIEKQLEEIRSKQDLDTKPENDSIDEHSDDDMEIEEENVIEVEKRLAVAAVKSVKSLDCPLCNERFQHPRMLPCMHTFCSSCIQKRITEENTVSCPICLRRVKLNLPTVDLLPLNAILDKFVRLVEVGEGSEKEEKNCSTCEEIALFWCVECQTDFCEKCKKVHLNIKAVSNHRILTHEEVQKNVGAVYNKTENCKEHKDNEMNMYCEACDQLICRDCTLINHKHHNYGFLKDCVAAKRRKLKEEVERARSKVGPLQELIEAVEEDIKETEHDNNVQSQIKKATDVIIAQVRAQEKELLKEISTKARSRSETMRSKYKELRYAVDSSQCCLDFMSAMLDQCSTNMHDLVSLAPLVRTRVAEITAYRPEVELNRKIPRFKSCPDKTRPTIGRVMVTFNYNIIGEHPHLIGGEGTGPGEFKFPTGLAFHPNGYIVVVDRANTLQVLEPNGSFLKEITKCNVDVISRLKNPNGVAVDKAGYFYVADSSKHRIAVYNTKGKFSHEIGTRSRSIVPNSPILASGNPAVPGNPPLRNPAIPGNPPLPVLERLTSTSSAESSPSSPLGLPRRPHRDEYKIQAEYHRDPHRSGGYRDHRDYTRSRDYPRAHAHPREREYGVREREYSAREHHRERDYHYYKEGKRREYDREGGRQGEREGGRRSTEPERRPVYDAHDYLRKRDPNEDTNLPKKVKLTAQDVELNGPRGVEISSNGLVVVADTTNHCVKVYSREGVYMRTIGEEGANPGQLRTPSGVSLDTADNVFVTDTELHRITVYKITGEYITHFGKKGSEKGEFLFPSDVAVDVCDNVFVSDCDNNRIQVFDKEGNFIRSINLERAGATLKKPLAVAVDKNGNVAVCDTGNHRVWLL